MKQCFWRAQEKLPGIHLGGGEITLGYEYIIESQCSKQEESEVDCEVGYRGFRGKRIRLK